MLLLVLLINDKFDYIKYDNDLNVLSFRYMMVLGFCLQGGHPAPQYFFH